MNDVEIKESYDDIGGFITAGSFCFEGVIDGNGHYLKGATFVQTNKGIIRNLIIDGELKDYRNSLQKLWRNS